MCWALAVHCQQSGRRWKHAAVGKLSSTPQQWWPTPGRSEGRGHDSSSHLIPSRDRDESMFVCFSFRAPLPPPLGKESIEALSYQACWPLDLGWVLLRRWAGTRANVPGREQRACRTHATWLGGAGPLALPGIMHASLVAPQPGSTAGQFAKYHRPDLQLSELETL